MEKHFKNTVLFFDIDGTLVNPKTGKIPESAVKEIAKWRKEGYACCLCTGRTYDTAKWTDAANYEWDGFIGINGADVRGPDAEILYQKIMPEETVLNILQTAEKLHHPVMLLEDGGYSLIGKPNGNLSKVMTLFPGRYPIGTEYHGQKIYYAMVVADTGYDYSDYEKFGIHAAKSYYPYADLVMEGTSKAFGIDLFMKYIGASQYYAFGDSLNDYEMLSGAKIAVAMGSGDPKLFPAADIVTGPIDKDGLAETLKSLLENENRH